MMQGASSGQHCETLIYALTILFEILQRAGVKRQWSRSRFLVSKFYAAVFTVRTNQLLHVVKHGFGDFIGFVVWHFPVDDENI